MSFWKAFFSKEKRYTDGEIDVYLLDVYPSQPKDNIDQTFYFRITLHGKRQEIGYVSVRDGEGGLMYYAGHIGYHITEKERGKHYALRACRLIAPALCELGFLDAVITCNPDNEASIHTIENLKTLREARVPVPEKYRKALDGSTEKLRYIWDIKAEAQSRKENADAADA
ncbi:MAG: GNAT family N-acetyltransferase [Eubacteriales bacterium]|nr:GNAT family N-acetyltransferase [Eubacteriales bacterium]MDD3881806.1 GNAT family N-acetyltransferase [Eubacteriales bacterium]MDD4513571.1 GNAT family N-acetyltransferase [Eubacteriales bacterium]